MRGKTTPINGEGEIILEYDVGWQLRSVHPWQMGTQLSGESVVRPDSDEAGKRSDSLAGLGAEREGDASPGIDVGEGGGQVQHNPAYQDHDGCTEFEEMISEHPDLSAGSRGFSGMQPQLLHQDIGGRHQEDPELVRPEARATGAIDGESEVQFLSSVR